jgi:hypothetical protein
MLISSFRKDRTMIDTTPEPAFTDIELPAAEALLAGTLALMTGFDDPQADPALRDAARRSLLARKISANLSLLAAHPLLSPNFQTVVWGLCHRWRAICTQLCAGSAASPWGPGSVTLQ